MDKLNIIGKDVKKVDGLPLATGIASFTDDYYLHDPLQIFFFYSPFAHAKIKSINSDSVRKLKGVIDILSFENTPQTLHTTAGQGYPEPSPYDSVMFDRTMRFVGDRAAAIVAETEEIARDALNKLKIEFTELPAVFDPEEGVRRSRPYLQNTVPGKILQQRFQLALAMWTKV